MILFFDTETTGLPQTRKPKNMPGQPDIIQLAALLTDSVGNEKASISLIVEPKDPNFFMHPKAEETHGITRDVIKSFGVTQMEAITAFFGLFKKAQLTVAHNIKFDIFLMDVMLRRNGFDDLQANKFCTLEACTPILNLPPTPKMLAAGFNKPKSPNLGECYKYFFDEELEGAHDAMIDVRGCARVFFEIQKRGYVKYATV